MPFAIKAEVLDPSAETFVFTAQKTMYGGKHIAEGDTVFVLASENEGGQGLIARRRHGSRGGGAQARHRPADTAGKHHHPPHGPRQAAAGADGA